MLSRMAQLRSRGFPHVSAAVSPALWNFHGKAGMGAASPISSLRAPEMMCFQCEQTSANKGCTIVGVCSKTPQLAGLQDLQMLYNLHLCQLAHGSKFSGEIEQECRNLLLESSFATLTNVNFDDDRFRGYLRRSADLAETMAAQMASAPPPPPGLPSKLPDDRKALLLSAGPAGLIARSALVGHEDLFGVVEMATYGWKGTVAYFYHAEQLEAGDAVHSEAERAEVYQEFYRIGSYLAKAGSRPPSDRNALDEALGECLAVGALNLKVMKMLDAAHCHKFGSPSPVDVTTSPRLGAHSILVSGHDLGTLHSLLEQTQDQGVDVYTHGEMLPAHGYPGLRKFEHLRGHYGTHWGNQLQEFRHFPGAILMTSNCLRPPTRKYSDRLWTAGPVGFHDIPQIANDDFRPVIDKALNLPVFDEASAKSSAQHGLQAKTLTTGFGHAAVLSIADKLVDAIKTGALKNVFVIGGCDGTEGTRNYFTDLGLSTPQDSLILTLGCGKFRLNSHDHGTLEGIPRLLDMGQCNDAYGAVVVATKLAEALECSVHDLPLHFAVSWFEQKAVAVLLTLLHLELKNIRIGPAVPAFLTPKVVEVLNAKFGLKGIQVAHEDDDLADMLQGH